MTFESLARSEHYYADAHVSFVQPIWKYEGDFNRISGIDISDEIKNLIDRWHNEVAFASSSHELKKSESFKKIVGYGYPALEYIIKDLEKRPSMLMLAASEIAGESPITDGIRGDVKAMAGAWVGWYQRAKQDML